MIFKRLVALINVKQMLRMADRSAQFHENVEDGDVAEKPVRLSLHLIVKRHLPQDADKWNQGQIVEGLNKISHLRLDRENIQEIDGLELLGKCVTNVYLQMNRIERIENLECLTNLSFLTLANNRIRHIENLTALQHLLFLDVSENLIDTLDVGEIPQSVIILNLTDNPVTTQDGYRESVMAGLPKLQQLDLRDVSRDGGVSAAHSVATDVDERSRERDARGDNDHKHENVQSVSAGMMIRSQKRLEEGLNLHREHQSELDDLRQSLNMPASARSSAAKGQLSQR